MKTVSNDKIATTCIKEFKVNVYDPGMGFYLYCF